MKTAEERAWAIAERYASSKGEAMSLKMDILAIVAGAGQISASGWQPIETAPHATDVLLYSPVLGSLEARMEVGYASGGRRDAVGSTMWYHGTATHWMPLPAAPTPEAADDARTA